MAFDASGIRKAEMARRMGISKVNVDRLFDLTHYSRLDQIEAAFRALGKELAIEIRDAALSAASCPTKKLPDITRSPGALQFSHFELI